MRSGWMWCVVVLAGCIPSGEEPPSDLSGLDLAVVAKADLAGGLQGTIGSPCKSDDDCKDGIAPTCFIATLFNESDKLKTPGGYCSASCNTGAQCGQNGDCRIYSDEPHGWCFAHCNAVEDCRTGFACFTGEGQFCFPTDNLNCDPTAVGGTCNNAPLSNPGECIRSALGTGNVGFCYDGCTVGAGSCPPSSAGARQCVVYDHRGDTDPSGASENDTMHGAICRVSYSSNADGAECAFDGNDFIDACVDGDECFLAGETYHGDNRCHRLCTPSTGSACPTGQSCQDTFGLLSSTNPVGLCH